MIGSQNQSTPNDRDDDQLDLSLFRPLVSAADMGRSNHARAWYTQYVSDVMEEYAEERAPENSNTFQQHLVGIAGEVATAAWQGVPIDKRVMPDYEGDDGYDLEAPQPMRDDPVRIEVKTTEARSNPERTVTEEEIDQADYFILCSTNAPKRYVDIVGYAPRPLLKMIGKAYGRDGYLLSPEWLYPVEPISLGPDDVRNAMYG